MEDTMANETETVALRFRGLGVSGFLIGLKV